jgi:hypothetical protein
VIEFVKNYFLKLFAKMRKAWHELIRMQRNSVSILKKREGVDNNAICKFIQGEF